LTNFVFTTQNKKRDGHILSIAVDVIVNSTNDTLNDKTGQSGDILMNGGQAFINEINGLEGCRTGEAKITRSHSLPHNRYDTTPLNLPNLQRNNKNEY
jgi:O-acetyl-ADP-ribose deacetylase (regulator of RNase III)